MVRPHGLVARANLPNVAVESTQHYEAGNDFYRLWLDSNLTYSCALWDPQDTLETAQVRKLDYIASLVSAGNAERILDVGCGWGAMMRHLIQAYDVRRVVGLTLNEAQYEWIRSTASAQIEVHLKSWTDYAFDEKFDAIVAVGSFEHFAHPRMSREEKIDVYSQFFQRCHSLLKPRGKLAIQSIGVGPVHMTRDMVRDLRFLMRDVFPSSSVPHISEIAAASEHLFEMTTLRNDRLDYARTCREWLRRLVLNRAEAVHYTGTSVVECYERYLDVSAGLFESGRSVLFRIGFQRAD